MKRRCTILAVPGLAALLYAAGGVSCVSAQDPNQNVQENATERAAPPAIPPKAAARLMRLTAGSEKTQARFGEAITFSGNYRLDECLKTLRWAVAEDPDFAAGWSLLAYYATDSHEAASALERAQKLAAKASPSEMLFVRWVVALKTNDQIAAISNLNDLVKSESRDKFILYLAGRWFLEQKDSQRAIPLFEKVLQLDPQFSPVLNRLGYAYAAAGDMPRAEALMQHYVATMPNDPNPEDSYGDILFKAGRYEEARAHFVAALAKDPAFGPSQHELGDVLAMLGDQDAAREAYRKSALAAANPRRSLEYRSSIALTFLRQNQFLLADREYETLAAEAKAKRYTDLEAGFYEAMALYQLDDGSALKHLEAAEQAIRDDSELPVVARDEHMAVIRRWRGVRSMHAGNPAMAEVCLRVMQERYEATENEFILDQLHGLRGALFVEQRKYKDAIGELEQVDDDPFSLELLAKAKRETGDVAGAEETVRQLLALHSSTMGAVLVVEPARQKSSLSADRASVR